MYRQPARKNNETVIRKSPEENGLRFYELFTAAPHVFLRAGHPLSAKGSVKLGEMRPYPRLTFIQGNYESACFAEETPRKVLPGVCARH